MGLSTTKFLSIILSAFLIFPSISRSAAIQGKEEGTFVSYCSSIDFVGTSQTLTNSGLNCTLTSTSGSTTSLVTLTGVADGSTNLGTFTGSTIDDNLNIKEAFQDLETFVEGLGGGHDALTLGAFADKFLSLTGQQLDLELTDPGADRLVMWDDDPGAFTWIDPATYLDNTDSQDLSLADNTLSLSGSDVTVDLSPYLDNTDDQTCAEVAGCVENAITAADVPAAETDAAHDECSEISGCVVGALTSGSIDTSAKLRAILTDEIGATGNFLVANGSTLTAGNIPIADGSNINFRALSGDVTVNSNGVTVVEDDSHAHIITDIDIFTSANLYGRLNDETGSASGSPLAVFNQGPTINGATLTGNIDAGGASFLEFPNGADPTCDDPGEVCHDTTDNQLVYDDYVLSYKRFFSGTILSPAEGDSAQLYSIEDATTLVSFKCQIADGSTSVPYTLYECTNPTTCTVVKAAFTCGTGGVSFTAFDDSSIASGSSLIIGGGAPTGSPTAAFFSGKYTINRE